MKKTPSKVLVLGIDCPIAPRVYKWAKSGQLPALARLIDNGVFCSNCLAPFPTITPPNWTTISTGAWAGTHGMTDYMMHTPGAPLDEAYQGFDASDVRAERLWEAAAREGKHSIVINWPTSWPSSVTKGYQIAGYGLAPTDSKFGLTYEQTTQSILAHEMLISTQPYPQASPIELKAAKGWSGLAHSPRALEAEVDLDLCYTKYPMKPVTWYLLVDRSGNGGYDSVIVSRSKSKDGVYARLRVGEWSANLEDDFETAEGTKRAAFRLKLVELSPDAEQLRIYVPGLAALHGWGHPASIEDEITSERGIPSGSAGHRAFICDWIDGDTWVETVDLQHKWIADAAKQLFAKPWDLLFLHIHTPDWIYHTISVELEPMIAPEPERVPYYTDLDLKLHQSLDRALGEIVEAAGEDTLVVVVSDHGAKPRGHKFNMAKLLEQAGLLAYLPDDGTIPRKIDWTRTRAVPQRFVHLHVNLKGRDPDGIVEPGEEYSLVQDLIVKALHEYVDPDTGLKPIALALRREDARMLGLYGNRIGDVIYALDPRYSMEHGEHLPAARWGFGDMRSLLIFCGPGVKKGVVIDRNVWLTDVVPTICHLAELPFPQECEGAVVYQALESPDLKRKELQSLRQQVARMQKVLDRKSMC